MNTLKSDRDIPLVWSINGLPEKPTVTVELYIKWYNLFLVLPDGSVCTIEFPDGFVDHVPKPDAVQCAAEEHGWDIDDLALELMVGRWEMEVKGNYNA